VKIGIQIPEFNWPGGTARLGPQLADIARTADDAGFSHLALMDHFFQIEQFGSADQEMLEAYTALAFMAAHTRRAKLLTLVTAGMFRHPGVLGKIVTTLDVLSGGRAELGIGAAWYEAEAVGLGIPWPSLSERFKRLEETVQIVLRMWSDDDSPYHGTYYQLERPLNSPQPLTRPHPPIMIGGSGEKKTLPMVARYAQASNFFPSPAMPHKLRVLREECEKIGRDYDEIEKTCTFFFDVGDNGKNVPTIIHTLERFAEFGIQTVIGAVIGAERLTPLEIMGNEVIPAVADL
jgi:F420-dependent oxidoreductase-like protein